ncbi:MAG TPA: phosphate regulon sensor histidine kinase PhoR [Burkholderiales bacterium]|jgi:two-component system phosphate regulon sensor histidine kinase PhoR|nr:phosphate regulon sensor histidine kinase PhoR [Burkholderiales bacterium]
MRLWSRPLSSVLVLCAAALLSWPMFGATAALCLLSAGLLILLLHHIHNLSLLHYWLREPSANTMPNGTGSWEYIFWHMVRLLKRQRASAFSLSKALERFERAGEALPDAVVLLAEDDRISWCNPRAEAYFGLRLERDRGAQITYLLRQPQLSTYLHSSATSEPLTLYLLGQGGERAVSIQLVPYGNSQKLLLGRDVTRWERLETTRRDFIANVSHELRTPLTVVHGFLETLEQEPAADPVFLARGIKLMSEQTVRMTRLVNDLLTLSRLENSNYSAADDKVNVPGLLESLQQEAMALSGGRHTIRTEIRCDDWLLGSMDELRSAFGNLVTNAVHYTQQGGTIELIWERTNGNPAFTVRDDGIGIESHHLGRLTERFYRVDKSRSRETGGTGLGLAIVKHVTNRHQGQLVIDSTPGEGSTFSITFPDTRIISRDEAAPAAAPASDQTRP